MSNADTLASALRALLARGEMDSDGNFVLYASANEQAAQDADNMNPGIKEVIDAYAALSEYRGEPVVFPLP